ncbi:MAG: GNAT family N-acetyltransferase [Halomonas sp.]|uniref:GNAT family N-acetyltransferase n=1 Tax=Halomonas sp. TaxID=1486246 RepID=UPI003F8EBFB3
MTTMPSASSVPALTPRQYCDADFPRLRALWLTCFPDYTGYNSPEVIVANKLAIDDLLYVIDDGETLIASCMIGYDGHRGWLYSVAVAPDRQGEGLGRQMVEFAVTRLRELGCVKVNLQIRGGNEPIANFYKELGFELEERISMGMRLDV